MFSAKPALTEPPFCSAAPFVISRDGCVQIRPIWRLFGRRTRPLMYENGALDPSASAIEHDGAAAIDADYAMTIAALNASAAGRRAVVVPAVIKPALVRHVATFTAGLSDSFVFASPAGAPVRDGNFRHRVRRPALARAGLPGINFRDLRHTAFLRLRAHPGPCSGAGGVVFTGQ
jgi:hypothetical protein